jgi:2-aminoadipate transaminase
MDEALQTHFGGIASWQKPLGGYFFWLDLPAGVDAADFQEAARAAGTGFLPGTACSTAGGLRNGLRLSFAHYPVPEIHEGIARLKRAFVR